VLLLSLAAASSGSSIPIAYGDCIEDSILVAGEEDTLTFDGAASEVIIARMARISGDLAVHLEIFEPFGALIADSWGFAYTTADTLTLPSSGSYMIVASDYIGAGTGPYGLSLQRTKDPGGALATAYGSTIEDSVPLVAEMDAYTFPGTVGEVMTVRLAWASGSLLPLVQLFDPEGRRIAQDWTYPKAVVDTLVLPETGSYAVIVSDQYGPWTGGYGLSLQCTSDPVGAAALSYGDSVEGSIAKVSELAAYTFAGTVGDLVALRMTQPSEDLAPYLELFAPSGEKIAEAWGAQAAMIDTMPLPASGTYAAFASDYSGFQKGDYSIVLVNAEPGAAHDFSSGERTCAFRLSTACPNPFKEATVLDFHLAESAAASLNIFDLAGHRVRGLADGRAEAGTHRIVWDGRTDAGTYAPSGLYICRLEAGGDAASRRIVLLR
jgi:hypothetical protein